jgi:hypothetical protein
MKITLKIKHPTVLVFDLPDDTDYQVDGRIIAPATPMPDDLTLQIQMRETAKTLANTRLDEKKDFAAVRTIRDVLLSVAASPQLGVSRQVLEERMAAQGVDGNEFIGLFTANGQSVSAAQAIAAGINSALGARGQA